MTMPKPLRPTLVGLVAYWIVALTLLWAAAWPNAFESRANLVLAVTILVTSWTTATKVENVVRRAQIRALIKAEEASD